ncbi:MAG: C40 family peptidase [Sulfitobacter sp.]
MTDPRNTPDPAQVNQTTSAQLTSPVTNLCRNPNGPRERQLIHGDTLTVLSEIDDWSYVQSDKDEYCGYILSSTLGDRRAASHKVVAPATHVYERPDFKSPDRLSLSFASRLLVTNKIGKFAETELGFVPLVHLADVEVDRSDPAAIAALFLGTPYLWGGNSRWGIDCSGLVQASLLACAIPCPGDSDQQQAIGIPATGPYKRNDLLFWKGHVALVSDENTLIHANAHAMSVTYEPIDDAIKRIINQGDGPVTAHRRF